MLIKIHLNTTAARTIGQTVETLKAGGLVVYPTDTVYGLGCSVEDKDAIEKIHLLKRQRKEKPFSFICSDLKHVSEYAHVTNAAFKIMKRLIPGPYTFILPAARMKHLPKILVSKRRTVGIRVPDNRVTHALVTSLGHPILSTSVTDESGVVMTDPEMIRGHYGHAVDIVLDGGMLGSEVSTIIDLTGEEPQIVRAGAGSVDGVGA